MLIGKQPQFAAHSRFMYFAISESSLIFEQQNHYQNNYPETKRLPFYVATP